MISLAREAWDAIQAAEMPESEKAKSEAFVDVLEQIARRALKVSDFGAKFFAIDPDGEIWAYRLRPYIDDNQWISDEEISHKVGFVITPPDWDTQWKKACYEISQILSDDL